VDQNGNLLTGDTHSGGTLNMSMKQLDYTRSVEETLSNRIVKLLAPIVGGDGKVRAQVTAEMDFTQQEQTRENYEPDPSAVRSEQQIREINRNDGPTGIPGALTNQPPRAGLAPEEGYTPQNDPNLKNSSEKTTRNYEIDRTVSHIKNSVGNIRRLSVAVVLDDKTVLEDGELVRAAMTEDETRGDTLTVVNASFVLAPSETVEQTPIWQEDWFWDLVKQLLAGLAVLIIIFGVIRPMLRDLSKREEFKVEYPENVREEEPELENVDEISRALEQINEEVEQTAAKAQAESNSERELIEKVRTMVAADPKMAAHILKQWMSGNR
jgi:flagellar M-ring protein FliF